jgi:hypothetical protein
MTRQTIAVIPRARRSCGAVNRERVEAADQEHQRLRSQHLDPGRASGSVGRMVTTGQRPVRVSGSEPAASSRSSSSALWASATSLTRLDEVLDLVLEVVARCTLPAGYTSHSGITGTACDAFEASDHGASPEWPDVEPLDSFMHPRGWAISLRRRERAEGISTCVS